ncbi:unnamed protein product [Caenorhabditis angaria]|uniref:RING-type domain-containing protein n=1 Tax=Caenorhabditis angaria TaxID=860376 RepID=A0A9P1I3Q9_9PELO|nr:unnamed protein product [Caenorhabditis angaria]
MNWVHCNTCGIRPKQIKIYITTCGHLICDNCTKKVVEKKCLVCRKEYRAEEVCGKMRPFLMNMFREPQDLAAKLGKELGNTIAFQTKQKKLIHQAKRAKVCAELEELKKVYTEKVGSYQTLKKEYIETNSNLKTLSTNMKEMVEKLTVSRKENSALKADLKNEMLLVKRRCQTEPPAAKNSKNLPNSTFSGAAEFVEEQHHVLSAFEGIELSKSIDEAPSRVTSTPIPNNQANRKEFMRRMFSSGVDPSPILTK